MTLYFKAGGTPQPLPARDYDGDGTSWTDLANNPQAAAACGWTAAPEPPAATAGNVVQWVDGAWAQVPLPPTVWRIGKYWLFQRFTEDQERAYAGLEYQARNLTPTDLADPTKEGLFQLQRFIRRLDALAVVELTADATKQGFGLMQMLGIFGDPSTQASTDAMNAILLTAPTPQEWSA